MMKGNLHFILIILVTAVNVKINSATPLMKSNGTASGDIDGRILLNLGRQLNKPMLTLFGMAIRNLEKLHRCEDWTKWSNCGAVKEGYIATRQRTRTCELHPPSLKHENKTTETDTSICEGICPKDYNVTANGFCVKLYTRSTTFDGAEEQCQKDGGHVIYIDSELKHEDIKNVLQGFCCYVFVDGRRKNSSSPWLAWDGSQKEFFKWASGQPDSNSCTQMHPSNSYWYDQSCTSSQPFVCELVH